MTALSAIAPLRLPAWENAPQWARTAWSTKTAQDIWAPRISRINQALSRMEVESVYRGLRHSALVFKTPEELVQTTKEALGKGCSAFVLSLEGATSANYAAGATPYVSGKPFRFRTIVTKDPAPWIAHSMNDELGIGGLLGYPTCCSDFYKKTWVDEAWRDTTYPMSLAGTAGPVEANILLRWIGVRFVRHLPCSFACEETVRVGKENAQLGIDLGYHEELAWMQEMLSWNIEWTSLHGIAEIKTPVLKISTNTDPFATKVVVQKKGSVYPEDGATGLVFPFEQPTRLKVTESKSFLASLGGTKVWEDNGFASKEAMALAHSTLLDLLANVPATARTNVLDLGCGNGVLLEKICALYGPATTPHGVELQKDRWFRAQTRLDGGVVMPGNVADLTLWNGQYDVALFMPGRLTEVSRDQAAGIVAQLTRIPFVLLYAYGDRIADADFTILATSHTVVASKEPGHLRTTLLRRNDGV